MTTTTTTSTIAAYFIGYELTIDEASIALYVQFVLVICLFLFTIILAVLLLKKGQSRDSLKASVLANDSNKYEL